MGWQPPVEERIESDRNEKELGTEEEEEEEEERVLHHETQAKEPAKHYEKSLPPLHPSLTVNATVMQVEPSAKRQVCLHSHIMIVCSSYS